MKTFRIFVRKRLRWGPSSIKLQFFKINFTTDIVQFFEYLFFVASKHVTETHPFK